MPGARKRRCRAQRAVPRRVLLPRQRATSVRATMPGLIILTATIIKAKAKRLLLVTALVGTESSTSVRMQVQVNGVYIA